MNKTSRFVIVATFSLALFAGLGCERIIQSLRGLHAYTWQSTSMEKTIYRGDSFLCDMNAYKTNPPVRGDVVVFTHKDTVLVKRLIGLPGDKVEGKNGVVSVNVVVLTEAYAQHVDSPDAPETFGPVTVAPGSVFLLGDNRNHSLDSRLDEFGEVKLSDIQGKAISIVSSVHGQAGQAIR